MAKNPCAFGCNLERSKRAGRRTISINVAAKNPRKLRAGNLRFFYLEEIRQMVYPHSSFTRGRGTRRAPRVHLDLLFHLASSLLLRFTYWLLQVLAADPHSIQADTHSYVHLIWITDLPSCRSNFFYFVLLETKRKNYLVIKKNK